MSIRRRIEIQATRKRDLVVVPTIEDVGRIVVDDTEANRAWSVFNPDGTANSTGFSIRSTVDTFSHLTAEIGPFATLGEGYRFQQEYRLAGEADNTKTYTRQVFFDVVTQEWQSELTLESLRHLFPSIEPRLTKQGAYFTPVKTAEAMAALYISDAMDRFDNVLRSIITQSRIAARVSLVPDTVRFDRVLSKIVIGLVFRADLRFELAEDWFNQGKQDFQKITLIGYDTDENFIIDDEIKAPDRDDAFGIEFLGKF